MAHVRHSEDLLSERRSDYTVPRPVSAGSCVRGGIAVLCGNLSHSFDRGRVLIRLVPALLLIECVGHWFFCLPRPLTAYLHPRQAAPSVGRTGAIRVPGDSTSAPDFCAVYEDLLSRRDDRKLFMLCYNWAYASSLLMVPCYPVRR